MEAPCGFAQGIPTKAIEYIARERAVSPVYIDSVNFSIYSLYTMIDVNIP
jgi:hypothetical protein